jgi:hypothetical protein
MHEWNEAMGEISGFGGDYEKLCRDMVLRGVQWLEAHPEAKPDFSECKGVFGIIEDGNADATTLVKTMLAEEEPSGKSTAGTNTSLHAASPGRTSREDT